MEGADDLLQPEELGEDAPVLPAAITPKASAVRAVKKNDWALRSVLKGGYQYDQCAAALRSILGGVWLSGAGQSIWTAAWGCAGWPHADSTAIASATGL
jgi:hypothetical protein